MPEKSGVSRADIVFNQTSVRSAHNQKLLREWLSGLGDQYPGRDEGDGQVEYEEKGIFTIEPEIAGLGVPAQSLTEEETLRLDPFARSEDASTAFLRQQLIGKKSKDQKTSAIQRSTISLPGLEPRFQLSRAKASDPATKLSTGIEGDQTHSSALEKDLDSDHGEDDIGRSGVGKSKYKAHRKSSPSEDAENIVSTVSATLEATEPESAARDGTEDASEPKTGTKRKKSGSKPKARSYLDEILAQKEAKKKRKKAARSDG